MDSQLLKYKRRFYRNAILGLLSIFVIGVVGFFALMPEEQVSVANLKKLRVGMTKQEVKAFLGSSLPDQCRQGEMMHWLVGYYAQNAPPLRYMWAKPGDFVYFAILPQEQDLWGKRENWGSSSLFVTIEFDDQDHLRHMAIFPASCDEVWSGSCWDRLVRKIQHWRERWKI